MSHTVVIDDLSFETVQLLVDYLYGAFHPDFTYSEAVQLFVACDKYCIDQAILQCTRALKAFLNEEPSRLFELVELADEHYSSALEQVSSETPLLDSLIVLNMHQNCRDAAKHAL